VHQLSSPKLKVLKVVTFKLSGPSITGHWVMAPFTGSSQGVVNNQDNRDNLVSQFLATHLQDMSKK